MLHVIRTRLHGFLTRGNRIATVLHARRVEERGAKV